MRFLFETISGIVGTFLLILLRDFIRTAMAESHPSLPKDHPASIQFSAWLSAFNTADKGTLAAYHSDSAFPYASASRDIKSLQSELSLAQASGGFNIVDIEDVSSPADAVIVLKEKNRPIYARVSIHVDVFEANYPVTEFKINAINTPLKFIPEDDPRRGEFEKALRLLDSQLRRKLVDGIVKILREEYVEPELGENIANAIETHCENGDYDEFEDSAKFAQRLTKDMQEAGHGELFQV